MIFLDHARTGDGILTALQLLRAVVEAGQPLSALAGQVEKCPAGAGERPGPGEAAPSASCAGSRRRWRAGRGSSTGAPGCWCGTRGPNPLARVMVEGDDQTTIEAAAREIAAAIQEEIGAMA